VDAITAWFEPGNMVHLRVALKDGVLLGGNNIDLMGTVSVEDGKVMVNATEAGANGMTISGPMMDFVNSYINSYLASFGVAANVETGDGTISISLGG
jgi:hypothetical protein